MGDRAVLEVTLVLEGPKGYRVVLPGMGVPDCLIAAGSAEGAAEALAAFVYNELESVEEIDE